MFKYVIVGLGNPGARYEKTRHNAGFMLVDRLAKVANVSAEKIQGKCVVCEGEVGGSAVLLAKPQTFMNRSGLAVQQLLQRFPSLQLSQLLIVYDDVALPLGAIRLRPSGSAGGQKGIKSIIDSLGSTEVPRLRIGVRGESIETDLSDYVLKRFRPHEWDLLEEALQRGTEAVKTLITEGIDAAMSKFNRRESSEEVGNTTKEES